MALIRHHLICNIGLSKPTLKHRDCVVSVHLFQKFCLVFCWFCKQPAKRGFSVFFPGFDEFPLLPAPGTFPMDSHRSLGALRVRKKQRSARVCPCSDPGRKSQILLSSEWSRHQAHPCSSQGCSCSRWNELLAISLRFIPAKGRIWAPSSSRCC